jgi:CheY-like chemotaxis protein
MGDDDATTDLSLRNAPVLVVEDDPAVRDSIAAMLSAAGYQVVSVGDGQAALDFIIGSPVTPSVVLLDLKMPVMNGLKLLAIMRSYYRVKTIPVVALTANTEVTEVERRLFDAWLNKPFTSSVLLTTLARFADR